MMLIEPTFSCYKYSRRESGQPFENSFNRNSIKRKYFHNIKPISSENDDRVFIEDSITVFLTDQNSEKVLRRKKKGFYQVLHRKVQLLTCFSLKGNPNSKSSLLKSVLFPAGLGIAFQKSRLRPQTGKIRTRWPSG